MTTTIDANVLLYASDVTSPHHEPAARALQQLADGPSLLYVFWPVAIAYLRIATHPSIFDEPLAPDVARANIAGLLDRPHVRSPGEAEGFWEALDGVCAETVVRGNLVADAHLVALMRQHEVRTIWTSDRDFRRFDGIEVRDPLT